MRKGVAALTDASQIRAHRWWLFVLLLLAGASHWLVASVRPNASSTLASEAVGCAWAALVALAFGLQRSTPSATLQPPAKTVYLRWFFAGAILFGGPTIALLIPGRDLDSGALTIALALTPIIIAIAASAFGTGSSEGIAGRIWPSLAAVAGLLLVLVQPSLGDVRADLALLLAPLLTGVGAALFTIDQPRAARRIPLALFGASTLFFVALAAVWFASGVRPTISLIAVACDGILSLLSIITLAQLGAARWSSQFTWVPLLIILEGIVMVRPPLTTHWIVGLALLLLAGIYLLLPAEDEPASSASPVPTLPR